MTGFDFNEEIDRRVVPALKMHKIVLGAEWAVTRGISFGAQGKVFARLSIACRCAVLAAALKRLERALRGPGGDGMARRD